MAEFNLKTALKTSMQPPPGRHHNEHQPLALALPSEQNKNPPVFNSAMKVRMRVFVDEQHCSATAEIDSDDSRSWHWVISEGEGEGNGDNSDDRDSANSNQDNSNLNPIAVIRLVPPPHQPHEALTHPELVPTLPLYDWAHEPYIKLTRVAVVPEYRGRGLGRELVDIALQWAAAHAEDINTAMREVAESSGQQNQCQSTATGTWKGLVLVHAQVDVERMYQGLGFQTDETLGRWDEEGIEHVGMFKRIQLV